MFQTIAIVNHLLMEVHFFFNKPNSYIQAFSCCYLQSYNFLLFIFRDISISFLLCCRDGIGTPALCIPSSTIKGYSYVKSMSFQGMWTAPNRNYNPKCNRLQSREVTYHSTILWNDWLPIWFFFFWTRQTRNKHILSWLVKSLSVFSNS